MVYLDNAATTPISPEVLEAMMPYLTDDFGNAGTMYGLGRRAAKAVAKAREQVAALINCEPSQIIFTSGGSEANSLVFEGLKPYLLETGKTHIITSKTEHDSVLKSVEALCRTTSRNGIKPEFDATFLDVDRKGCVDETNLKDKITDKTGLVSVMYVNNETGSTNSIELIGNICHDKGVLFHTDCVQALSTKKVDAKEIGCDFLSISAHKINAPKGVGALYVRNPSLLSPIIHGGSAQEFGYRGGTENVAGIVGFGRACEILKANQTNIFEETFKLKTAFFEALRLKIDELGLSEIFHVNSPYYSDKILNIRFDGVDGQSLLLMLDSIEIYISAGSACRSYEAAPSHVLIAMGLTEDEARESVRISFSHTQTVKEIRAAAVTIAQCVKTLLTVLKIK